MTWQDELFAAMRYMSAQQAIKLSPSLGAAFVRGLGGTPPEAYCPGGALHTACRSGRAQYLAARRITKRIAEIEVRGND